MKYVVFLIVCFSALTFLVHCKSKQTKVKPIEISVSNPTDISIADAEVYIPWSALKNKLSGISDEQICVLHNNTVIASQWVDEKPNGKSLLVLVTVPAQSQIKLMITKADDHEGTNSFSKRTYAELSVKEGGTWEWVTKDNGNQQYEYKGGKFKNVESYRVPEQHTDHSFDIRYEGPGWESDKVGYRFYLDWRNAVDVFGKKTAEMVLQNVGLDGFDSYHESCEWGQDIFKVGETLGLGSIAYWSGTEAVRVEKTDSMISRIAMNGLLKSAIETQYYGWQFANSTVDLHSYLSIVGGSRLTHCQLELSKGNPVLCTGIIKYKGIEPETNFADSLSDYVFLATYGLQSLANDSLGLAIIAHRKFVTQITEDKKNQIMVLQPINQKVDYYFLAAWEKELNGITNKNDFNIYLENLIFSFNNPIKISQ